MTLHDSRRARLGTFAAIAVIAVAAAVWLGGRPTERLTPAPADLYTASDPGLVGSTGRPQLVEFYHPG